MRRMVFLVLGGLSLSLQGMAFELSSDSLKNGGEMSLQQVFNSFGCKGKNISPDLKWKEAPEGTKSFAITAYDPDAPTGSGWWHWSLYNIPSSVHQIEAGASDHPSKLPSGSVQGKTDFGKTGYGGACPPVGDKPHHYLFTVYALKTDKLALKPDATGAMLGYYLNQNTLAKDTITVTYGRSSSKQN